LELVHLFMSADFLWHQNWYVPHGIHKTNGFLPLTNCYCELMHKINVCLYMSSWLSDTKRIEWDAKLLTGLVYL
jgi:hypothetical protein